MQRKKVTPETVRTYLGVVLMNTNDNGEIEKPLADLASMCKIPITFARLISSSGLVTAKPGKGISTINFSEIDNDKVENLFNLYQDELTGRKTIKSSIENEVSTPQWALDLIDVQKQQYGALLKIISNQEQLITLWSK